MPSVNQDSAPLFSCLVYANTNDGPRINNIEDWQVHGGPKDGDKQWKDFRSAKELARAWLRSNSTAMPVEYSELLSRSNDTRGFHPTIGIAEVEIRIDEFGGPRNSDMVVLGDANIGRVMLAVEGKADEEFAKPIGKELLGLSDASNKPKRIARLVAGVLDRPVDEHVRSVRYQLLHSLAATAIEARRHSAALGVLLIHEFISLTLDFERVTRNANDLKAFIRTIPAWKDEHFAAGTLLPPITLKGNGHIPNDQEVTIGKVRTLIPLDAGERKPPSPGYSKHSRQFLIASPSTKT